MSMHALTIELPTEIYKAIGFNDTELVQNIKLELAIRLYSLEKISLGKAAQIVGKSRFEFESLLSDNHIPISYLTYDEVMSDAQKLNWDTILHPLFESDFENTSVS